MKYARLCLFGLTSAVLAVAVPTAGVARQAYGFTYYPAFTKRHAVVEAATDKGLIVEMIVRCPGGPGIVTFSKVEGLYCGPDHRCARSLQPVVQRLCRQTN